jgi:hypothetical protein
VAENAAVDGDVIGRELLLCSEPTEVEDLRWLALAMMRELKCETQQSASAGFFLVVVVDRPAAALPYPPQAS